MISEVHGLYLPSEKESFLPILSVENVKDQVNDSATLRM